MASAHHFQYEASAIIEPKEEAEKCPRKSRRHPAGTCKIARLIVQIILSPLFLFVFFFDLSKHRRVLLQQVVQT
jgi:hypothetical protein